MYVLVHDTSVAPTNESLISAAFLRLQSRFSPRFTRLLALRPLTSPPHAPSEPVHCPLFFPRDAPPVSVSANTRSASSDDFIALTRFTHEIFSTEIVPELERRVDHLSKHVSEHRKGVKNVLRSFWRKPDVSIRAPSEASPDSVRYRFDSSEGQTLLLADTFFALRDYEAAYSTYKLLREDFRADNSTFHLCHICVMMAACQLCIEPRYGGKDLDGNLRAFKESAFQSTVSSAGSAQTSELVTTSLCLALLAASMYVSPQFITIKAPKDAAAMLIAAAYFSRYGIGAARRRESDQYGCAYPFLTGLLTERASICFALAKQHRKYALYAVIAAHTFLSSDSPATAKHGLTLLASASGVSSRAGWTSLQGSAALTILSVLEALQGEAAAALLVLLCTLRDCLVSEGGAPMASVALRRLLSDPRFLSYSVAPEWRQVNIVSALQSQLSVTALTQSPSVLTVSDLQVPSLDMGSVSLLVPMNGLADLLPISGRRKSLHKELLKLSMLFEYEFAGMQSSSTLAQQVKQYMSKADEVQVLAWSRPACLSVYPEGENVTVRFVLFNPLDLDLVVSDVKVHVTSAHANGSSSSSALSSLHLQPLESSHLDVALTNCAQGVHVVDSVEWTVNGSMRTRCSVRKPGELLHKTMQERCTRARAEDESLVFRVNGPAELLRISIDSLKDAVCNGETLDVTLHVHNDGSVAASSLLIKISGALALIHVAGAWVHPTGPSNSFFVMPSDIHVPPKSFASFRMLLNFDVSRGEKTLSYLDDGIDLCVVVATKSTMQSPDSLTSRRYASSLNRIEILPSLEVTSWSIPLPSVTSRLRVLCKFNNCSSSHDFGVAGAMLVCDPALVAHMSEQVKSLYPLQVPASSYSQSALTLSLADKLSGESSLHEWLVCPSVCGTIPKVAFLELARLHFEVEERRQDYGLAKLVEAQEETGAPKTISQVRRERKVSILSGTISSSPSQLEFKIEESSVSCLEDIASKANAVLLSFIWQSGDRFGFTPYAFQLPQQSDRAGFPAVPILSGIDSMDSAIVCKLSHPLSVVRAAHCVIVAVELLIRSYYHTPVLITVEALDSIRETDLSSTGKPQLLSDDLRWIGKTSHLQKELLPGSERRFTFSASISNFGVFELQRCFALTILLLIYLHNLCLYRFKIIVGNGSSATIVKLLQGHHIIHVVEPSQ